MLGVAYDLVGLSLRARRAASTSTVNAMSSAGCDPRSPRRSRRRWRRGRASCPACPRRRCRGADRRVADRGGRPEVVGELGRAIATVSSDRAAGGWSDFGHRGEQLSHPGITSRPELASSPCAGRAGCVRRRSRSNRLRLSRLHRGGDPVRDGLGEPTYIASRDRPRPRTARRSVAASPLACSPLELLLVVEPLDLQGLLVGVGDEASECTPIGRSRCPCC